MKRFLRRIWFEKIWTTRRVLALINSRLGYEVIEARPCDLWRILTALRGPDRNVDCLKTLSTGRVRAIACPNSDGAIAAKALTKQQQVVRDKLLAESDGHHFSSHYDLAVSAIRRVYGYDLWTETEVKR